MKVRISKRCQWFKEPFGIKGTHRRYPKYPWSKVKDWLWRSWMNIFGIVLVPSHLGEYVKVSGKVLDLKAKFIGGNCLLGPSCIEIRGWDILFIEGKKYTIDFGDPVRLFDLEYVGKVSAGKDDSDGHLIDVSYLFKVGNAQVSINEICYIRIISVSTL